MDFQHRQAELPCPKCFRVPTASRYNLLRYLQLEIASVGRACSGILHRVIDNYRLQTFDDSNDDDCCSCIKETIRFLLNSGASIYSIHMDTMPLTFAIRWSLYGICRHLLSVGADPNVGTIGNLPLVEACRREDYRMIKMLLSAGADVDGITHHLRRVCRGRATEMVLPIYDMHGNNVNTIGLPVCVAIKRGDDAVLKLLLDAGANLIGYDTLHCAMEYDDGWYTDTVRVGDDSARIRVIKLLLDAGADPNKRLQHTTRPFEHLADVTHRMWTQFRNHRLFAQPTEFWRAVDTIHDTIFSLFQVLLQAGSRLSSTSSDSIYRFDLCRLRCHDNEKNYQLMLSMIRVGVDCRIVMKFSLGNAGMPGQNSIGKLDETLWKAVVQLTGFRTEPSLSGNIEDRLPSTEDERRTDSWRQMLGWLDHDNRNPASLKRMCRTAIRNHLMKVNGHRSLAPLVEQLTRPRDEPLTGWPSDLFGKYLLYDGPANEEKFF